MRNPRDAGDLPGRSKGRLEVRRLDVTDPGTYELPGDLRVLVNNAGIDTEYLPVEHSDLDDWRKLFETNVLGTVGLTMAAIPTLRANQPSVVCNITSSSILACVPFYSAYRATKAAVSAFGDSLRVEVASSGIRVVEIMPGPIDTDMFTTEHGRAGGHPVRALPTDGRKRPPTLRKEVADPMVVAPTDAAVRIVDAILDDGGPMRYGCDPLSVGPLGPVAAVRRRDHLHVDGPRPSST